MLQVCDKVDGVLIPSKDAVLEAISWSVAHHVDIVNMSLVIRYDKEIAQAIEAAARDHGIIFVAAVGNKSLASRFAAHSRWSLMSLKYHRHARDNTKSRSYCRSLPLAQKHSRIIP